MENPESVEKRIKKRIKIDVEGERAKAVALAEQYLNQGKDFREMSANNQRSLVEYFDFKEEVEQYIYIKGLEVGDKSLFLGDFLNEQDIKERMNLILLFDKEIDMVKKSDLGEDAQFSKNILKEFRHHLAETKKPEQDEAITNRFAELFLSKSITKACLELGLSKIESHLTTSDRDNFAGEDLELVLGRDRIYIDLTMSRSSKTMQDKEQKLYNYQLKATREGKIPDVVAVFSPLLFQSQPDAWKQSVTWFIRKSERAASEDEQPALQPKRVLKSVVDFLVEYFNAGNKQINTPITVGRLEEIKLNLRKIQENLQFDNNSQ